MAGITYKTVTSSKFEPGHSTLWTAYFTDITGKSLNIAPALAPIIEYNYDVPIIEQEVTISPLGLGQKTIKAVGYPTEISLTFVESDNFKIYDTLHSLLMGLAPYSAHRALSLDSVSDKALTLVIEEHDKGKNLIDTKTFWILPTGTLPKRGDQEYSLNTIPVTFMVVDSTL